VRLCARAASPARRCALEGNRANRAGAARSPGTFTLAAPSLAPRGTRLAGRAEALAAIPGRDITAVTLEGRLGNATEVNAQGRATINGQVLQLTIRIRPLRNSPGDASRCSCACRGRR
jgi:hypothetical protein